MVFVHRPTPPLFRPKLRSSWSPKRGSSFTYTRLLSLCARCALSKMKIFSVILCIVFSLVRNGCSNEIEIDSDGNSVRSSIREEYPGEITVSFVNTFDETTLSVYWVSDRPGDPSVHMFDIPPEHSSEINTFVRHQFYFTDLEDPEDRIDEIQIVSHKKSYFVGPRDQETTIATIRPKATYKDSARKALSSDGRVTLIGHQTTAMSAKFRCLAKKVDYYYDDGGAGTFQGTLTLGKETTTNTYEGHVFYFTMPGKQHQEIARFSMNKNQVCGYSFVVQ